MARRLNGVGACNRARRDTFRRSNDSQNRSRRNDASACVAHGRALCRRIIEGLPRVIDLRSIFPYDWKAISQSVAKTGRVLIVNEDTEVTNFGEHLLRRIIDQHFYELLVQPHVLLGEHIPGIGLNPVYEQNSVPQLPSIRSAMLALVSEEA